MLRGTFHAFHEGEEIAHLLSQNAVGTARVQRNRWGLLFEDYLLDYTSLYKTLSLVVTFENCQHFPCLGVYFDLKQFNRNKLWCPPKCVPFALFNYSSLPNIVLGLSSAVTKLPNKTSIFHDFQGPIIKFHDFPGLDNEILKFHDFPGFPWPVRTLWTCRKTGK